MDTSNSLAASVVTSCRHCKVSSARRSRRPGRARCGASVASARDTMQLFKWWSSAEQYFVANAVSPNQRSGCGLRVRAMAKRNTGNPRQEGRLFSVTRTVSRTQTAALLDRFDDDVLEVNLRSF